jgi:hypothetical protein
MAFREYHIREKFIVPNKHDTIHYKGGDVSYNFKVY